MIQKKYSGVVVPLITPFTKDGKLDNEGIEKLIEHIVSNHTHPFILGTTGEALSLTLKMKDEYLKKAVEINNGRKTLYAGIASLCFEDSVEMAKRFFDNGADIVVAHLPGYYKLSDSSILKYFTRLADKVNGPMMIYNIPSTTHMSIPINVIEELEKVSNIIGLKDSERDEERINILLNKFRNNANFSYFLGWAPQSANFIDNGGDGIVPSTGNAYPELYYNLYKSVLEKDMVSANKIQELTNKISEIYQKDKLLSEALPGLKVMLETLGLCQSNALAPCFELTDNEIAKIKEDIKKIEIHAKQ